MLALQFHQYLRQWKPVCFLVIFTLPIWLHWHEYLFWQERQDRICPLVIVSITVLCKLTHPATPRRWRASQEHPLTHGKAGSPLLLVRWLKDGLIRSLGLDGWWEAYEGRQGGCDLPSEVTLPFHITRAWLQLLGLFRGPLVLRMSRWVLMCDGRRACVGTANAALTKESWRRPGAYVCSFIQHVGYLYVCCDLWGTES